jgi:hypothetical protein
MSHPRHYDTLALLFVLSTYFGTVFALTVPPCAADHREARLYGFFSASLVARLNRPTMQFRNSITFAAQRAAEPQAAKSASK